MVRVTSYNLTTKINSTVIANVWKKDHLFVLFLDNNCKLFVDLLDLLENFGIFKVMSLLSKQTLVRHLLSRSEGGTPPGERVEISV